MDRPTHFIILFLTFPYSFNVESLRGHAVAKGLKDTIDEIQRYLLSHIFISIIINSTNSKNFFRDVGKRMYEIALRGGLPDSNDLLSKNDMVKLKRCVYAQGAASLPPITTHNIVDDHLGKKGASKK